MTVELDHAKRATLQATFCPIQFKESGGTSTHPDPGKPAIERAAPLRAFQATKTELLAVLQGALDPAQRAILIALGERDPTALIAAVNDHDVPQGAVVAAVLRLLKGERRTRLAKAHQALGEWITAAEARLCASIVDAALTQAQAGDADKSLERPSQARDEQSERELRASRTTAPEPHRRSSVGGAPPEPSPSAELRERLHASVAARLHGPCSLGGRLTNLLASGICPDDTLTGALAALGVTAPDELAQAIETSEAWNEDIDDQAPEHRIALDQPQPIGYLHLERLSYVPAGVEHGELVHSIPLAPGEFVSIVHKEWSLIEEEFSKLIVDQFEDYSEQGVVDKTDMSHSSTAERQQASAFNVSVSISGGYGPVSGSITSGYSTSQSATESLQSSLNRSQSVTKKASARTRKEHRVSFRLAKKSQEEDQTARVIKNPDPFNPVRYDFYQLMRKWRVNLHRYGVRLTYDLTIPEPAYDLLAPYIELDKLNTMLEEGFAFDVDPNHVNRANYLFYATKYGVALDPPPPLMVSVQAMKLSGPWPPEEKSSAHLDELHVAAPEGYTYAGTHSSQWMTYYSDAEGAPDIDKKYLHGDPGVTADIGYMLFGDNVSSILTSVRVWFILQQEREQAWRAKAYEAIRGAAEKEYIEKRQMLQERRARILLELSKVDALTLRRREREELMKAVLRWLFGVNLHFSPTGFAGPHFDGAGKVASSARQAAFLEHGAMISFLHQAIEWENINSFLYPYFWTPRDRWPERMNIRHEDPFHEAFLRAGAARVVLPIRPGWERAFLSVLKTGKVDGLDGTDDIYLTIAEEIENYAKTNYPGIIPANPDEIDPEKATRQGEGILVGSWYEYTPTGAIDIKVGEAGPSEGEYRPSTWNPTAPWAKVSQILDGAADVLKALAAKLTPSQP